MKKDCPKISVIMPSLNVEEHITKCIDSVVNQTFKDLEIICVDGGSSDKTLEILKKYAKNDSRIRIIETDIKSYGYQMNLGISESSGEYIGIVETDDFIDEKMYETLYALTDNSSADIAKVNFYHYYGKDNFKADQSKKDLPNEKFNIFEHADFINGHPSIWAAIYRKEFLDENNIDFMEVEGGGWVDNPFLFKTALSAKNIRYCHDPYYYYRELNPTSSTNDLKDMTLPMRRMLNLFDVLDEYSCRDKNILMIFYVRIFWHISDILKKDNYEDQSLEIFEYTHEVVKKMDEKIVNEHFSFKDQKHYYQYLSPLNSPKGTDNLNEMEYILKEHEFIYNYINHLESKNSKLKSKNRKLKKKNKKIIGSKSYKLGTNIAKPIRYIKKFK